MIKMKRNYTTLKKMTESDDGYVKASPQERVAFVWEITAELWSLKEAGSAERRLQRDVATLVKQEG